MSSTFDKYREYVITGFVKAVQPIEIERAQGAVVTDSDGRDYIDCFAGISVVNAGHSNPEVVAAWEKRTGKKFDLTVGDQPNDEADSRNVMDPEISYAIMSYGMRTGMFTGRKLSQYISGTKCEYKGARKIINGTDHDDGNTEMGQHHAPVAARQLA